MLSCGLKPNISNQPLIATMIGFGDGNGTNQKNEEKYLLWLIYKQSNYVSAHYPWFVCSKREEEDGCKIHHLRLKNQFSIW